MMIHDHDEWFGSVGEPVTLNADNLSQTEQRAIASGASEIIRCYAGVLHRFGIAPTDRERCEQRHPLFARLQNTRAQILANP